MKKPTLLVLLQCPWKCDGFNRWHPTRWRQRFIRSRTGRRLFGEVLPPDLFDVRFCNSNPKIAYRSGGVFPPNLVHVRRQIRRTKPDIVLVCGKVAQNAVRELELDIPAICMPHPAARFLSREETKKIRQQLSSFLES